MAAPHGDGLPAVGEAWKHAPCMLLTLDQDDRIITANQRFLDGTGHQRADVLGRVFWDELLAVGSRVFYQTQLAPVLQLDERLDEVMVDLRTADGRRVPALMNAARQADPGGPGVATRIALMTVPDRRAFEDRLRQSRDEAEQAHRDADLARLRLELLAHANAVLASSLEIDVALHRLARTLTTRLADWCIIRLFDSDEADTPRSVAMHTDPARQPEVELLAASLTRNDSTESEQVSALYKAVGFASVITVPVTARNMQAATITLARGDQRAPFTDDDLADLTDVANRTGMVLDNLRRQAREHSNSIALQHALLTTPPAAAGFEIATRYLPATNGNEVGGDWYDALLHPDGSPLLVIGDVVGHDIHAAAAMGQLRGIIRTLAYTGASSLSEILTRADDTARGLGVAVLATAILARLRTGVGGDMTVAWSNAGHPPPLVVTASGVSVLHAEPDRLLGLPVELRQPRHDHSHTLHPGETLVFYTDGLIERTDEPLDQGIRTLVEGLGTVATHSPDDLCDAILDARRGDTRDDIALLAVRITPPSA